MKNFGLIGAAGYIAPRHMKAILDTNNRLSVAYDINDSVGIIDSVWPQSEFFTDFERFSHFIMSKSNNAQEKLDYISVCSPNYLHHSHVAAALRMGANVICEKPLVPRIDLLEDLDSIEQETGCKVYNILQLRHHAAIKKLRETIKNGDQTIKHKVDLTYITSRGRWYMESWKGDAKKSFGLVANIGVHFFDMLHFVFGPLESFELHHRDPFRAAGILVHKNARVRWFLSINNEDLPSNVSEGQSTYREINISGKSLEFSGGFTDLHTESYSSILAGNGFGLSESRYSVEITEKLRNAEVTNSLDSHPFLAPLK